MKPTDQIVEFIKRKEGWFPKAYRCPAGVVTIGYGTTRWDLKTPVRMGETITKEEAERQLLIEIQRVCDALDDAVKVPLTDGEASALISWGYNVGTGWITGKGHTQATLIKLLNQGKYDTVPGQLLLFSRTIGGKTLPGLLSRRKEEAQMWLADDHGAVVASAKETKLPDTLPEGGVIPEAMPQAVTPVKAEKTTTTVATSPSARWSLAGIAAGIGTWLDGVFGWSTKTAQQVVDANSDTNGIQTIIGALSHNASQIALGFMILALVVVLGRKLAAAAEGRSF